LDDTNASVRELLLVIGYWVHAVRAPRGDAVSWHSRMRCGFELTTGYTPATKSELLANALSQNALAVFPG